MSSDLYLQSLPQRSEQQGFIQVSTNFHGPIPRMKFSHPIGTVFSGHLNLPNRCIGYRGRKNTTDEINTNVPLQDMYEPVSISLNTFVKNGTTYLGGEVPQGGYNILHAACNFATSKDFKVGVIPIRLQLHPIPLDSQNGFLMGNAIAVGSYFPAVPSLTITGQNPSRTLKLSVDTDYLSGPVSSIGATVRPFLSIDRMGDTNTETKATFACSLTLTSKSNPVPEIRKINVEIIGSPYIWRFNHDFKENNVQFDGNILLECPIHNAYELLEGVPLRANIRISHGSGGEELATTVHFNRTGALIGSGSSYSSHSNYSSRSSHSSHLSHSSHSSYPYFSSDTSYVGSVLSGIILLASAFAYFF